LTKAYSETVAVRDVVATFPDGTHVGIVGPSGCGKSTLLRLLAGLEAPSSGTILIDDVPVSNADHILVAPHKRGIGMVFQDLALWPNLTVLGNVLLGLSGTSLPKAEARKRALDAAAVCGVVDMIKRKPGELSGGQQQRTALARALAVRPKFLLLDEPFSSLDLTTKSELLADIQALATQHQITLLLVTHDPIDVLAICPSLLVMEAGVVKENGPIPELMKIPSPSRFLGAFIQRVERCK
jgi:ABC-type Fe3+/spermidine/putrescine transport system ATPase subunit